MFAAVAPRYDLLNRVLSARLDVVWRRASARALRLAPGSLVADLCCGTGDQALALHRQGLRVIAADFCLPMLVLAQPKYRRLSRRPPVGLAGDAMELPLPSARFAGATVSFGLRNVADLDRALAEIARILAPGGRAAILEFTIPRGRALRGLYLFYFRRLLPLLGRLLSPSGPAYAYLPDSVMAFPQRDAFLARLAAARFEHLSYRELSRGIVALYIGSKAA